MQRSKEKKIVIRDSEAEQHLRAMREAREAAERADREAGACGFHAIRTLSPR